MSFIETTQPINWVDKVLEFVSFNKDERIILMRQKEVVMWLFEDLSFLPSIENKNKTTDKTQYKVLEDQWGRNMLKTRRPDLKLDKQWTNKFGEHICEEVFILLGQNVSKPVKKEHYQLDLEVDDAIIEVKTGTFHTSGTAYEKILGCPFKYAQVPDLYSKPLKIICIGGAERICKKEYGNLGPQCVPQKQEFLDFYKSKRIHFLGATDLIKSLFNF